ncbi:flagellar basal body-associated FliL family protein [Candidatus Odyssella thessalonicensis]|uniref:flagellar basal body-associated FliL family protein n=1 Tax=Candidatus Odyssella thessalonicensis TaxID=84647 RepID=UPI0003022683|nr:flagellar basal body-associated FliL family protein [Candidatus Odyssella thessalonicensis]
MVKRAITVEDKMSEKNPNSEAAAPGEEGSKKKIIIIAVAALLAIAAAVIFFTPLGGRMLGHTSEAKEEKKAEETSQSLDITKVAFTTLPEILLNLRNANGKSSFLKVTFIVQSPNEEVGKKVEKLKPIIVDQFQDYLRGLDVEDLAGSAGLQRVRSELLTRINNIVAPEKVSDILFGPFLIQ